MTSAGIIRVIRKHNLRVFTTSDLITLTGVKSANATNALRRLASQDLVSRIKKGVWVNKIIADLNPYEAVGFLRAPWPAYVSLHSALADYGVIEEIPQIVYGVSPAIPKRYRTSIGEFRIHHLPQRLIWGYEIRQAGGGSYPIAEREKAFLDLVYLALTPRSPLELPHKRGRKWDLDRRKIARYAKRFQYKPLELWLKQRGLGPPLH